jgi:hypothetical protein
MSESWINMKYNFEFAVEDKILSQEECQELLQISKDTYYPKRSFNYIIKKSSLSDDKKRKLINYINSKGFDIKNEDAKKVIEYIKQLTTTS